MDGREIIMNTDRRQLIKALRKVGAKPYQVKMAATLLAVNGLKNALDFVYGLQARGLTGKAVDNERDVRHMRKIYNDNFLE